MSLVNAWWPAWPQLGLALAGGYLLGSLPFGLLLTRLAGLGDVRKIGSGNIGATNVLRTGSRSLALLTLLLDGGKGALAVVLAGELGVHATAPSPVLFAGIAAMLGHVWPVWLRFRGGKGVSTALGVLLALSWPVGLIVAGIWLLTAWLFRWSSLAALVAAAAAPGWMLVFGDTAQTWTAGLLALLVWWRHRENMVRLWRRQEPKIGAKAPVAEEKAAGGEEKQDEPG